MCGTESEVKMLSKLSKIGLSAEAIYSLDCDNHKEYLQRKTKTKDTKCGGSEASTKVAQSRTFTIKKQNPKESKWRIS